MNDILAGNFAPLRWQLRPPDTIRVVTWNIDRGLRHSGIADFLSSQDADVLVLQEVDVNARRTHRLNIAEELALKLGMNYIFGREFQELTQGSKESPAYHGQATLSRWRLKNPRIFRFRHQSGFWRPRWFLPNTAPFQERLGGRIALATEVHVMGCVLMVYNLHLESRGDDNLRVCQLEETLDDAEMNAPRVATLLAGDLNFDITRVRMDGLIEAAGFRNVLRQRVNTTVPKSLFGSSHAIDWALLAGPVEAVETRVHSTIRASDHYPISLTLRLIL